MRLLASTGPLFPRPLDWALGVVAEAGFDGAELMVTHDPVTQDADRARGVADAEGVALPVVHGPFLLLTRRVMGTDPIAKARRSVDLAAGLGADLVVVHPPYRWQGAFHRWLANEADAESGPRGVRVGVENLYPVPVGRREVRFHRYVAPADLLPFPHVVLDTSHLGVAGHDVVDAYGRLRHRLAHLHVSDHAGGRTDSHAPLGAGVLPLGRLLARVAADRAAGEGPASITLELDCRPHVDDRTRLVAFLRRELAKCRALLAGEDPAVVLGRPDRVPTT